MESSSSSSSPQSSGSSPKSKSSSPDPSPEAVLAGLAPLPVGSRGKKTRLPGMSPQMATFALQQRPRTKRACATKVKTGCITCKRRHIKCDETRPFCLKCTKSPRGPGVCEGYGPTARTKSGHGGNNAAPRRIIAKGTWRKPQDSLHALLEPGYESVFFKDPEERGYFDFWRVLVGNIYLFPSDSMARVLPQLARREPAIKHAALAMAAMARSLVPTLKQRSRRELYRGAGGPHYEFALKHYGRAIRLVRSQEPSSENMLWAIICSVLFVTFECLHGDRNAALSHVNHAYRMMEHYFRQRTLLDAGSPTKTPETDSVRAVCDDAAWIFQGMTMQSWSHNVLHSKDTSEMSWCCKGSARPFAVDEMPPVFDDLQAARRWWRVVQHYTCHRCPIYTDMYLDDLTKEMLAGSYLRSTPAPSDVEELLAVLPEFLGHLQRWHAAFSVVFDRLRSASPPRDPDKIDPDNTYVDYLLLWTDVMTLSYKDIRVLGLMTPAFREMVQLSRAILEAQSNCGGCSEVFSMDNGPTLALLTVACRCRDAAVRQEATALLGKHHRRDGLWDSRMFHTIAMRNAAIEEENDYVGGDDAEQWSRILQSQVHVSGDGELTGRIMRWHADIREWRAVEEPVPVGGE
ncbi:hypothetical protein CPLU01_10873 [Colletotrichum plurivorum]|uniref:Zn(2)-C6 fungal-type domain-containing protein n=1 Tax=Colletotrichum plurivorum TaxID=2175906 RepID=A0A8H6K3N5_9PEZI|nr:hypothetical protein CPLU01_10873 [Colletotrichum plurivorum]